MRSLFPRGVQRRIGYYTNLDMAIRDTFDDERHPRDPELQFLLGVAYLSGWIPCEDPVKEAEWWFRRSADQDSPRGLAAIGYLHEEKLSSFDNQTDQITMLNYHTRAAELGNAMAQYRLARFLYQNNGDMPIVRQLLEQAANDRYLPAKELLAEAYPETVFDLSFRTMYGDDWAGIAGKQQESSVGIFTPISSENESEARPVSINPIDMKQLSAVVMETYHTVTETHKEVVTGNQIAEDTCGRIIRIEAYLQSMKASLDDMWTDLRKANAENAEILNALQQTVGEKLDKVSAKEMEDAEEFMSILFKDDWRNPARLCDESCDALVTAHVLMSAADRLNIKNYSGIVITAVWALEHECRRRFFDLFIRYLDKHNLTKPDKLYTTRKRKRVLEFTLGKVYTITQLPEFENFARNYLLSENGKNAIKEQDPPKASLVFTDYCIPNGDKIGFTLIIKALVDTYRNKAAHAEVLNQEQAEECCQILGITEAHKELNNIEGALKSLLWLTAPLERSE